MRRRLALIAGTALASVLAWEAAASAAFCASYSSIDRFVFPYLQWADVAQWLATTTHTLHDQWIVAYLAGSGAVAAAPFLIVAHAVIRWKWRRRMLKRSISGNLKPTELGVTSNHGEARWLTVSEMQKAYPGPHIKYGGIVVGEAYRVDEDRGSRGPFDPRNSRTWGLGGKRPLLIDPCVDGPTHSMIFAGPGSFKTQCAVTTILHWLGSKIILDPSCELGPMLEPELRERGEKVHQMKIANGCGINVLDWIDISDPEAEAHVKSLVALVYDEEAAASDPKSTDPFFQDMGRDMVTCLLLHMLWNDDTASSSKTLATLREGVATPEGAMPALLRKIHLTSNSRMAREIAGTLMDMRAPETFSGIYSNAIKATAWLSVSAYADMVSRGSFKSSDLLSGHMTVFLQIPLHVLVTTPALARVIVGALMNRIVLEDGNIKGRILFLMDEAARLGKMEVLEVVRDAGRKYGITLQLLWQAVGQLQETWGQAGFGAWVEMTSWIGYAAIRSMATADEVSKSCGQHGVLAYSEGDNRGRQGGFWKGSISRSQGANVNIQEISRKLILPEDLTCLRADEMIILARSSRPMRCGRAIWFRRPELKMRVAHNRFLSDAAD